MRTIPYPMLLIFAFEERMQFYAAHQRVSQSDSSKNTIEECIATDWIDHDKSLFSKLDIRKMRFTNLYALYSDLMDIISIYNVSDLMAEKKPITGTEARELAAQLRVIEGQIVSLRARLKKESQFNRKMELNIEIKRLEQEKRKLFGGDFECGKLF